MKVLAKLVFGTLGCVLLIFSIVVISSQPVHAAVATITRDQDNPARHPFTAFCQAVGGTTSAAQCDTILIPAGEEVIIETVSINGSADPNNFVLTFDVETTAAGTLSAYLLNPLFDSGAAQPNSARYAGLQSLRLYADPGTRIRCEGVTPHTNPSVGLLFNCQISGYSVTLP